MRILLAMGLAALIGSQAGAAVKIGYLSLPGELAWVEHGATGNINKTDGVSQGVILLGVDVMEPMSPSIGLGISVGIGLPAGSIEFDRTKEYISVGGINPNDGDKVTVSLMTVPVLGHACYHRPLGKGTFALDLGVGAILVGLDIENVETYWWDSMASSPYRGAGDVKMATQTVNSTDFTPVFTVQLAPCYTIGISEKDSIGLQIPMAYLATAVLNRTELDYQPPFSVPTDSDPLVGGLLNVDEVETTAFELGGFSWGVNIVYMRKF